MGFPLKVVFNLLWRRFDVCMESTGKYWVPVFNLLEDQINVTIANPKWVKAVKGNKDDTKDSKWIGDLFRLSLVPGSFIPCKEIRILRESSSVTITKRMFFLQSRRIISCRMILTVPRPTYSLPGALAMTRRCTFFPKAGKDYTRGQPRYTLLKIEKQNLHTGETIVQYDRLTLKESIDK